MAKTYLVPRVGIGVLAVNSRNEVLLGLRKGSHGSGTYALPGGFLELYETWEDCAARELKEECGIDIRNLRHVGTTNNIMRDENRHTITVFMQGEVPEEEVPQNLEPDKCEGWSWVTW
eukprot:CAMPEP_0184655430 /NCGR_PEP_ID=MMETSP0308-20130426/13034_1 /TAXON_ID=38269 /ORGANISM="Gloeochaete witrockiana, Strain SAG 46.84" /LENGTH=117 /DNA_ID=CAMNT_0027091887 /DNA_START=39 /DNA_END=389 /DNA_ORIENTATION=+